MRRQLVTGLLMTIALTLLLGVAYPLVITGISQVAFNKRANGSFVENAVPLRPAIPGAPGLVVEAVAGALTLVTPKPWKRAGQA